MSHWPWWVSGAAIGLFVTAFAALTGKALAVSSGLGSVCRLGSKAPFFRQKPYTEGWRLWFLAGLPLGGLAAAWLTGGLETPGFATLQAMLGGRPWAVVGLLFLGGALVGFGARWANGCTSGHSIVGLAQGAKSSLVATLGFMIAGVAVANALVRLAGGAR